MTTAPSLPLHAPCHLLETEQRSAYEEQLLQISRLALAFSASLDLTDVLEAVTQHTAQLFGGVCRVRFAPAQRPMAKRRIVAGPDAAIRPCDGPGADATYAALLARLHEPASEEPQMHGAALLFAPLIARGQRIGSLDVVIPAPDDGDVVRYQRLLRTIAAHAALAIDNADRFAQAQLAPAADPPVCHDPGPMLALVAHDLRSPLTALSSSIQTLARFARGDQPLDRDHVLRLTHLAEAAVAQLGAQITALTPDPELHSGVSAEAMEAVDLVRLARLLTHFYQQTTGRHTFTVKVEAAELYIPLTRAHAERVLSNLLVNGIKYSPMSGEVVVTLGREHDALGDWATLSVRNDGIGIPLHDLPALGQSGYRARNVGAIPGTGFGLVSVREIVEQYGGTFAIQSVVGETTTVRIRLPLAVQAAP